MPIPSAAAAVRTRDAGAHDHRLTTLPDLQGLVRPGDAVVWGQCAGEPLTLTEALVQQRAALGPVSAFVGATFSSTLEPDHADHLDVSSFGAIGLRRLAAAGVLGIIPCHSGQVHRYITHGHIRCDVAFVQVSRAGPDGAHSYGVTNDYMQAAVARARTVVAEVNEQAPWTHGDARLDPARITYRVTTSRPLPQVPPARGGATELNIARHAAAFIGDGAILQIGIGAIPDAIAAELRDRRDLGLHSPMLGDSAADLIERGVITNARKPQDAGISVAALLVGTDRLYSLADANPAISVRGSALVSDECVLAGLPGLVTINSAIEVDLTGQVNAEVADGRFIGAVGGQADLVRAGHRSAGGRSIIALPATAAHGQVSRIVARLKGPVTTARSDADTIVTEFGAAELRGQTLAERARRLLRIAHPAFQAALEADLFHLTRAPA